MKRYVVRVFCRKTGETAKFIRVRSMYHFVMIYTFGGNTKKF